jgi:hypothetical protein
MDKYQVRSCLSASGSITYDPLTGVIGGSGGGGGVTGSGVAGQIAFWSGTSAITGENALWYDSTNDRVGIGTNSPTTDLLIQKASIGTPVEARVYNTDNTNGASHAHLTVITGGSGGTSSGGDPHVLFAVNTAQNFALGIDNSVSGKPFKLSWGANLGTNDVMTVNQGGDMFTLNNIIGGSTARGTRLTLVNAADTLASKTLVIRNAADSSETFSFTGNGIFNIGVANANSDVITVGGVSWFRSTNNPASSQFQSVGFNNTITATHLYTNVIGHQNTIAGTGNSINNVIGFNNRINQNTVGNCNIIGSYFDIAASSTRINAIGRRNVGIGTLSGTDLTFIGYSLENNTITLNTNIVTYFNNENMSHSIRKGGNIALLGEKYKILQDSTGSAVYRLSTYMDLAATNTITIHNGTAPTGNITDAIQAYAADITAGNTAMHIRNENGDIVKLYAIGGWGTPTGTLTRTTFDTTTVTLSELAERVAALISDLKTGQQLLKA